MRSLLRSFAFCAALVAATPSQGAAFRAAYPGCADKAVLKQAFKDPKDPKDQSGAKVMWEGELVMPAAGAPVRFHAAL